MALYESLEPPPGTFIHHLFLLFLLFLLAPSPVVVLGFLHHVQLQHQSVALFPDEPSRELLAVG